MPVRLVEKCFTSCPRCHPGFVCLATFISSLRHLSRVAYVHLLPALSARAGTRGLCESVPRAMSRTNDSGRRYCPGLQNKPWVRTRWAALICGCRTACTTARYAVSCALWLVLVFLVVVAALADANYSQRRAVGNHFPRQRSIRCSNYSANSRRIPSSNLHLESM